MNYFIKNILISLSLILLICCKEKKAAEVKKPQRPVVEDQGKRINFRNDPQSLAFFKTAPVGKQNMEADFDAPSRIIASIVRSNENSGNLILFENPDLTANYSSFKQHQTNIAKYSLNLHRTVDLFKHGSATGKEVTDARTQLTNEQSAIIEDEAKLRLSGLNPEELETGKVGKVWLICDISEVHIVKFSEGSACYVIFNSFPNEKFQGKIEDIGEVVDNVTRMVKIRIAISSPDKRLKAGMFGTVHFGIYEGNYLNVPGTSVITVEGKDYVFIKTNKNTFERKEVLTGQQIKDRIIIYNGIRESDSVVTQGAMQLKGLSFGF
jgi:cobalt-zinc-cadmium efflux system membrane fusion protein